MTGTKGADAVRVWRTADQVVVSDNGIRSTFPATDVSALRVETGNGNDRIHVRPTFPGPVLVHGGAGRNVIVGTDGDNRLYGSGRLMGRGGNDYLQGGGARDVLLGGPGDDEFFDSGGPDTIRGGPGADVATVSDRAAKGVGAEAVTFIAMGQSSPDPSVALAAARAPDGAVSVLARATHNYGGWERHFGDLARSANVFSVQITGTGGGTTPSLESDTHTYPLGPLAPGTYTLTARSDTRTLAVLHMRVTRTGLSPDTPTRLAE